MKKYTTPEMKIVELNVADVIATSVMVEAEGPVAEVNEKEAVSITAMNAADLFN